jgi:F-type H+-transporting ATPase subunit gamma
LQASLIAEEVLRENADAVRVLFNKFHSAISFKPTMATVLNVGAIERQLATDTGSKLDTYELEVAGEKGDVLQDLAEFQLAAVGLAGVAGGGGWGRTSACRGFAPSMCVQGVKVEVGKVGLNYVHTRAASFAQFELEVAGNTYIACSRTTAGTRIICTIADDPLCLLRCSPADLVQCHA